MIDLEHNGETFLVPAQVQCGVYGHTLDVAVTILSGPEIDSEPSVHLDLYQPTSKARFAGVRIALASQENVPFTMDAIEAALILMASVVGKSLDRQHERDLRDRHYRV